jgi:beta-RFAP synthase
MGLLDLNGDQGRLYGSIGMAVDHPQLLLRVEKSDSLIADGMETDRVFAFANRFIDHYGLPLGAHLQLIESIPSHQGLGSGTQLGIAVGAALSVLAGIPLSTKDIASTMGRGAHSGVGISAFERGGFIVDAGRRILAGGKDVKESCPDNIPAIIFNHPAPSDWRFIVIIPEASKGFSGERERNALASLPKPPSSSVDKISRLLLMKMLPALIEDDINSFGQALTGIQSIVGDFFASVQGGRFASPLLEQLAAFLLSEGAAGAGQSSWGPTIYGLVKGEDEAFRILNRVNSCYPNLGNGKAFIVQPRNDGAEIRIKEKISEGVQS